jgi:4a-hydroxytetrahydrobiopterin dehydratase
MRHEVLSPDTLHAALPSLTGWSVSDGMLRREVTAVSFPQAIELVRLVADVAEAMNHHPDIDIRWTTVRFALSTHDSGGITDLDLEQAAKINALVTSAL